MKTKYKPEVVSEVLETENIQKFKAELNFIPNTGETEVVISAQTGDNVIETRRIVDSGNTAIRFLLERLKEYGWSLDD